MLLIAVVSALAGAATLGILAWSSGARLPERVAFQEVSSLGMRVGVTAAAIAVVLAGALLAYAIARRRRDAAEVDLRTTRALLHEIIDNSPTLVHARDSAGALILANRPFRARFGADQSAPLSATDSQVLATGARIEVEEVVVVDSRNRFLLSSKFPLVDRDGERYGVATVSTDITERKHERDALRELNADLERSNAELAEFAYVASHDLSEPLRSISGFVQLLAKRYEGRLDEDADRYIAHTVDGVTRMRCLIEDLLAYSRAGNELHLAEVDAARVVRAVLTDIAAAIEEADARVDVGDLPIVFADGGQLAVVFQNLISNAIKFRSPDHPPVVRVSAAQQEGACRFDVRDNGIGVAPEHRDRIFRMFQRLHTRTEYSGTGIGLAVTRKIVERHGGQITVERPPGGGAVFSFTVPTTVTTPALDLELALEGRA